MLHGVTPAIGAPIRKLDAVTFDALLHREDPFRRLTGALDLRGTCFVSPAAEVQLAVACYALARRGIRPILLVDNHGLRTYLMRSGFRRAVDPVALFDPPFSRAMSHVFDELAGSSEGLIELTRIDGPGALPDLLDRVVEVLRRRLRFRKYEAFDVATAVSEITQNTFDHNQEALGFLAMQVYRASPRSFLEIALADDGVGLAQTLSRNPRSGSISSDLHAIRRAIEPGTSEHDDPTRGTGLYHLMELAYRHRGTVQIRSWAAKVRFRMDKRTGWPFVVPHMPGVHIALTLDAKSMND